MDNIIDFAEARRKRFDAACRGVTCVTDTEPAFNLMLHSIVAMRRFGLDRREIFDVLVHVARGVRDFGLPGDDDDGGAA